MWEQFEINWNIIRACARKETQLKWREGSFEISFGDCVRKCTLCLEMFSTIVKKQG